MAWESDLQMYSDGLYHNQDPSISHYVVSASNRISQMNGAVVKPQHLEDHDAAYRVAAFAPPYHDVRVAPVQQQQAAAAMHMMGVQMIPSQPAGGNGNFGNQPHSQSQSHNPYLYRALPPQPGMPPVNSSQQQAMLDYQAAAFWRDQQRAYADKNIGKKPSSPHGTRKRISPEQTAMLENCFQETPRPVKEKREELASATGLPVRNIQIWFQNRRAKAKANNETAILKKMAEYNNNGNQHQHQLPPAHPLTPAAAAGLSAAPPVNTMNMLNQKPLPLLPSDELSQIQSQSQSQTQIHAQPPRTPPMVGAAPRRASKSSPSKQPLSSKFAHPYLSGIRSSSNGSFKSPSSIVQRVAGSNNNIVSQIVQLPPSQASIVMASPYNITPQTSSTTIGLQSPISNEPWNLVGEYDDALLTPLSFQSPSVSPFMSSSMRTPTLGHNGSSSSLTGISDTSVALASPASFDSAGSYNVQSSRRRPSNLGVSRMGVVTPVNNANAVKQGPNGDYSWSVGRSKSATEMSFAFAGSPGLSPSVSPATPANQQIVNGEQPVVACTSPAQLRRSLSTSGIVHRSPYHYEKTLPAVSGTNAALGEFLMHSKSDSNVGSEPHRVSVVAEEEELGMFDDAKNDASLSFYFGNDLNIDMMDFGGDMHGGMQDISNIGDMLGLTN